MRINGRTHQMLVSTRGGRWRKVHLVMFTVHIDDSGTDPNQRVAIATALIIPAVKIGALEREWATLRAKESFSDFHMSECVWQNPDSEFARWDEAKRSHVIYRIRQIGKKFGVKAMSIAIDKKDYDEILPGWMKEYAGRYHYTWAIRNMIDLLDKWKNLSNSKEPFEYVYDWMDPKSQKEAKAEIDMVMAQAEEVACTKGNPGQYTNYSFRRREQVPGLQCTDVLAWTCYQFALFAHKKVPLLPIAEVCWNDYSAHQGETWLYAIGMKREHLKEWVEKETADGSSFERFKIWKQTHPKPEVKSGKKRSRSR